MIWNIISLLTFLIMVNADIPKERKLICKSETRTFNEPNISQMSHSDIKTCQLSELKILDRSQDVMMEVSSSEYKAIEVMPKTIWKFTPNIVFQQMPEITFLKIDQSEFEGFEMDDFKNASRLTYLHVHGNENFKILGPRVFSETSRLAYISLENNGISQIHKLAFEGISTIIKISLQGNRILMAHAITFANVKSLDYLNLQNNLCINTNLKEVTHIAQTLLSSSCHSYYIQNEMQEIQDSKNISMNIGVVLEIVSMVLTIAGIALFMKIKSSF